MARDTSPKGIKKHQRYMRRKLIRQNWDLYLLVAIPVLSLIIFNYIPMFGIVIAFQDYKVFKGIAGSKWVGLAQFTKLFTSAKFFELLRNTILINVYKFVYQFPIPIILALLLNEVSHEGYKKTVQTITYAPHFISTVVLCGALQLFLSPTSGLIGRGVNAIRQGIGLVGVNILMDGPAFKWVYVLSGVWQGTGWASVIYFAALSAVDVSHLEAAEIDGANKLQRMWYINLPVLMPTIVIQLILSCGGILGVGFEKVYLLQNDTILAYSEVISTYVYRAGVNGAQFSFGTAVGLFNNLINAAMLLLVNAIVRAVDRDMSLL